ncbi:VOC family protein [Henriciella litoralis]|uniref:VOC family protein n=1 Tax=Henriciella litoralis TaxID=568102 RepID=UPI000A000F2D|nr:VOC family protein [Henriciella litoralis]
MAIEQLGYVVVSATDMDAWDRFLVDVTGVMRAADPGNGAKHYRIDERPFRFRIEPGEEDRLIAAAYRISTPEELEALKKRVEAAGQTAEYGSDEAAKVRGVDSFISIVDPAGNHLEFYCGDTADDVPFKSEQGVKGFVTGAMGMGHAVLGAPNFDECHAFYRDVVGFHDTDLPRFKFSDDPEDTGFRIAFMHADNGRHHSLALGEHPAPPSGCVHLMLEMQDQDDVGRAHDRMRKAEIRESATLGRHSNDKMFSFYMRTPGGFDLEVGCDGLVLNPKTWETTAITSISDWGHVWSWSL